MNKEELQKLIDDDLGLLDIQQVQSIVPNEDQRLIDSFDEINAFIKEQQREPKACNDMQERQLFARLKAIRESKQKSQALSEYDIYGLLQKSGKTLNSIADIIADDALGILEGDAESIFEFKHVQKPDRKCPKYIAQRKACANFDDYEFRFREIHRDLQSGGRSLREFNDKGENLQQGNFYVLNGILLFLEKIELLSEEKTINGKRVRKDGRTQCIFENGTESDMLYRSLAKVLYQDGRIVTELSERSLDTFNETINKDNQTGFIYILKSHSTKPEIKEIQNLYKIGFSRDTVEDRIKNAEQQPTYLMAPVSIEAEYKCFDMNPQKLELILHKFFGSSCLEMDVFDNNGKRHSPREWFIIPISIIDQAINLIVNGDIFRYTYDSEHETIVEC